METQKKKIYIWMESEKLCNKILFYSTGESKLSNPLIKLINSSLEIINKLSSRWLEFYGVFIEWNVLNLRSIGYKSSTSTKKYIWIISKQNLKSGIFCRFLNIFIIRHCCQLPWTMNSCYEQRYRADIFSSINSNSSEFCSTQSLGKQKKLKLFWTR